jgi:hypothetical protein
MMGRTMEESGNVRGVKNTTFEGLRDGSGSFE